MISGAIVFGKGDKGVFGIFSTDSNCTIESSAGRGVSAKVAFFLIRLINLVGVVAGTALTVEFGFASLI